MANELSGFEAMDLLMDRLERALLKKFESEQEAGECRDKLREANRERDALRQEIADLRRTIATKDAQIAALRASQPIEPPPGQEPASAEPREPRSFDDSDTPF